MDNPSDPEFPQLRQEFLAHVHTVHSAHHFEPDPRTLCVACGIRLVPSDTNLYDRQSGIPRILYNPAEPAVRHRFTLWHEFAHHLFQTADEGFQALLEERHGRNTPESVSMEEALCYEAASLLLLPHSLVNAAVDRYGLDPQAALDLSRRCGASHEATLRRLLDTFDLDTWCLVMQRGGTVLASYTRTPYPIGSHFTLDAGHPLHQAFEGDGLFERRARMPFRRPSTRTPHRLMRAAVDGDRVLAIFADSFPPRRDDRQPNLFS